MTYFYMLELFGFLCALIFAAAGWSNVKYIRIYNDAVPKVILGFIFSIGIIVADGYAILNNNQIFYSRKPSCGKITATIICLEDLIEWKKDSVKYNYPVPTKVEIDTAKVLDSLWKELEKY